MSQSIPFQLSQAVVSAFRASFEAEGAAVHDNPTTPAVLEDGERVIFVEDKDDDLNRQPSTAEQRTFVLTVGVINRGPDARAAADADMELVKGLMRGATKGLVALGALRFPREGRRGYRLEGIDVGGALVLTEFHFDYLNPRPKRAGDTT